MEFSFENRDAQILQRLLYLLFFSLKIMLAYLSECNSRCVFFNHNRLKDKTKKLRVYLCVCLRVINARLAAKQSKNKYNQHLRPSSRVGFG